MVSVAEMPVRALWREDPAPEEPSKIPDQLTGDEPRKNWAQVCNQEFGVKGKEIAAAKKAFTYQMEIARARRRQGV